MNNNNNNNSNQSSSFAVSSRKRLRPYISHHDRRVITNNHHQNHHQNHHHHHPSTATTHTTHHPDHPDWSHYGHLLLCLFLTVSLSVISALDAERQCLLREEQTAISQLLDDDAVAVVAAKDGEYEEEHEDEEEDPYRVCRSVIQRLVLPAGLGTTGLSAIAYALLWYIARRKKQRQQHAATAATAATTSSSSSRDGLVRLPPQTHSSESLFSKWLTVLFFLLTIILGLQLWWVGNIMLLPRILDSRGSSSSSKNNNNNNNNNNQNPYTSLAAVDRFGHVGDNANLYYLTWMSVGLATALVYQVGTALVRAVRKTRHGIIDEQLRQQQQQHAHQHEHDDPMGFLPSSETSSTSFMESSSSKSTSSSSASIASVASTASAAAAVALSKTWFLQAAAHPWETWKASQRQQQQLQEERQKAFWYSSLYKLRIRTGIWTAALIASWLVAASSQYVVLQVLWPVYQSAQQQQQQQRQRHQQEASLYPSWHVCRVIQRQQQRQKSSSSSSYYYSSSSYGSNSNNKGNDMYAVSHLPPQFCHRTMAAWLAGVLSTILCATAIGMHLTAKQCFRSKQLQEHEHEQQHQQHQEQHDDDYDKNNNKFSHQATTMNLYDDFFMTSSTWYARQPNTIESKNRNTTWQQPRLSWKRMVAHHPRLPLRTELALSLLLSVMTGFNAVFCTGVQGPAATVGNLYYASWLAFLFCVRVALGCLEEFYRLEEDDEHHQQHRDDDDQENGEHQQQKPHIQQHELHPDISSDSQSANRDPVEKNRLGHVRSYFFLGLFSVICAASAYDAASNQRHRNTNKYANDLTHAQVYMMIAPFVVAIQNLILFALCLSKRCYAVVSSFWCGGLCSIVSFGLWLGNLILTMHSENSWAVNAIGEIKMANLYYFSWASMITSGLQMSWYVKKLLGIKMKDFLSVVWLAIVKVCFVILGASLHIWHSISDNCEFDEITSGAVTFCSRTILAMIVALTGMLVGSVIVLVRLLMLACPMTGRYCQCRRVQSHVELCISLFLVLLFGAAVALVTGIGGPGQSVGDLYYSTWLSFWVSLGVFANVLVNMPDADDDGSRVEVLAAAATTSSSNNIEINR